MKGTLSDHEIHALGSRFDVQVREEASYLLWYIWRDKRAGYSGLQACIGALLDNEELHSALQAAHAVGKYDEIREWQSEISDSPPAFPFFDAY